MPRITFINIYSHEKKYQKAVFFLKFMNQWIDLREKLQENRKKPIFTGNIYGFL